MRKINKIKSDLKDKLYTKIKDKLKTELQWKIHEELWNQVRYKIWRDLWWNFRVRDNPQNFSQQLKTDLERRVNKGLNF